ncbi:hypothetical protein C4K25_0976 [Pseudomonas chlororaphis]|nr:hypothetical protein C4K25_0976 [Pseudomonas chlororaphis]
MCTSSGAGARCSRGPVPCSRCRRLRWSGPRWSQDRQRPQERRPLRGRAQPRVARQRLQE